VSQKKEILNHLKQGNKITPIDALKKFGCFRLAARINDLKKEGHRIVNVGSKKYAEYEIENN